MRGVSSMRVIGVTPPAFGTASISENGRAVVYRSRAAFSARYFGDTFHYTITDRTGQTAIGQITVRNPRYTREHGNR